MLQRTLFWDDEQGCYFFAPQGIAPTKTAKSGRLSREFFVSRKYLSQEWSVGFNNFMANNFLDLQRATGYTDDGPDLDPPARAGLGERAPFLAIAYDDFRKGIAKVTGTTTTGIRAAAEAHLFTDPELQHAHQVWVLDLIK